MPKQKSVVKIDGTMDDMTFYKSIDGYLVKKKGGVSADKIKNDPNFVRVRENNEEFGNSAQGGKNLRDTVHVLTKAARDPRMISRLSKRMHDILLLDTTSVRGKRNVATGIATAGGKALLK